ncbi:MAG: sel1 repeat family protein [Archangiaceae bacterium]|nr:sel1 repeat family protein [Archangiaceae bacterium]
MTRGTRLGLLVVSVLVASPAHAHGDMAAKGIAELFSLMLAGVFFVGSVILGVVARRMTAKADSAGGVFRAGLVGVLALLALTVACIGAAMGSEAVFDHTPRGFAALLAVLPALFAAQFFVSARLYRRLEARGLSVGSIVLGVLFAIGAALAAFALIIDAVVPQSERTSGEVRAYREGCERGNGSDCNMLGLRLRTGSGVPQDAIAATRAFEKACTLDASIGCRNLAEMLRNGEGVPRDEAAAQRWMDRYTALSGADAGAARGTDPSEH